MDSLDPPSFARAGIDVRELSRAVIDATVLQARERSRRSRDGGYSFVVVDRSVRDDLVAQLEGQGAAVLAPDEADAFLALAVDPATNRFRVETIGQSAATIAGFTGIERPFEIKVIVVPTTWDGEDSPLAGEKMTPVLSLFDVSDLRHPVRLDRKTLGPGWSEAESDHHAFLFWPRTGLDAYQPLGTTILGGLTVGTLLSLLDIPIMHTFVDDFIRWLNKTFLGRKWDWPVSEAPEDSR